MLFILYSLFFKFYFIFELYNIVLVLPNIEMNRLYILIVFYFLFLSLWYISTKWF